MGKENGIGAALNIPQSTLDALETAQQRLASLNATADTLVNRMSSATKNMKEVAEAAKELSKVGEIKIKATGVAELKRDLQALVSNLGGKSIRVNVVAGDASQAIADLRSQIQDASRGIVIPLTIRTSGAQDALDTIEILRLAMADLQKPGSKEGVLNIKTNGAQAAVDDIELIGMAVDDLKKKTKDINVTPVASEVIERLQKYIDSIDAVKNAEGGIMSYGERIDDVLSKAAINTQTVGARIRELKTIIDELDGKKKNGAVLSPEDDKALMEANMQLATYISLLKEMTTSVSPGDIENNIIRAMNLVTPNVETATYKIRELEKAISSVRNSDWAAEKKVKAIRLLKAELEATSRSMVSIAKSSLDKALKVEPKTMADTQTMLDRFRSIKSELLKLSRLKGVNLTTELTVVNGKINEMKNKLQSFKSAQGDILKITNSLGQKLADVLSFTAMIGYMDKLIQTRGEFEKLDVSLRVMLKDAEKAKEIFTDLQKIAIKSPYTIKDLSTQVKQLAAYRIETEKLVPTMKMLGDIASGTGVDMQRLILAYGQVKTAQFLKMTEVRQFTEAGVDLIGGLAERFSEVQQRAVSVGEVMQMITKRMVRFQDVEAVMTRLTAEGGTFYKMQERQAETVIGMISNIEDRISIMFNNLGKDTEGITKKVLTIINSLLSNYKSVGAALGMAFSYQVASKFLVMIGHILTGASKIEAAFGGSRLALIDLNKQATSFAKIIGKIKGGYAIVAGLIAGMGVALHTVIQNAHKLTDELKKISQESDSGALSQISNYRRLATQIQDVAKVDKERASIMLGELKDAYGGILPLESIEIENLDKLNTLQSEYITLIRKEWEEKKKKNSLNAIYEDYQGHADKDNKKEVDAFNRLIAYGMKGVKNIDLIDDELISNEFRKVQERILSGEQKTMDEWVLVVANSLDKIIGASGTFSSAVSKNLNGVFKDAERLYNTGETSKGSMIYSYLYNSFNSILIQGKKVNSVLNEQKEVIDHIPVAYDNAKKSINSLKDEYDRFIRDNTGRKKYDGNEEALLRDAQSYILKLRNDIYKSILKVSVEGGEDKVVSGLQDMISKFFTISNTKDKNKEEISTLAVDLAKQAAIMPEKFYAALTSMNIGENMKASLLRAMGIQFDENDVKLLYGYLDLSPSVFAQQLANNTEKATAKVIQDSITGRVNNVISEVKKSFNNEKLGIPSFKAGDKVDEYVLKVRKLARETRELSLKMKSAGSSANILFSTHFDGDYAKAERAAKAYEAIANGLDPNKIIKEETKSFNKQDGALDNLIKKIIKYNGEMDKLTNNERGMRLAEITKLSANANITLPESYTEDVLNRWIDSISKLSNKEKIQLKAELKVNTDKKAIDSIKNELADLWSKYERADKSVLDQSERSRILAEAVKLEDKLGDLSISEQKAASKKRLDIRKKEMNKALDMALTESQKASVGIEAAFEKALSKLSIITKGDWASDTEAKKLADGIRSVYTNLFNDISAEEMNAFKSSETYILAMGNLDNMSADLINVLKRQLIQFKEMEGALNPAEARKLAVQIEKMNDVASDTAPKTYFDAISKSIRDIVSAKRDIDNLPELMNKIHIAEAMDVQAKNEKSIAESKVKEAEEKFIKAKESGNEDDIVKAQIELNIATEDYAIAANAAAQAKERLDNAESDYSNTQSIISAKMKKAQDRLGKVNSKYETIANTIGATLDYVEELTDALGLTFDDEAKAKIDGFKKGFALLSSGLALATTFMTAFTIATETETIAMTTLMSVCVPLLAIAVALGALTAIVSAKDAKKKSGITALKEQVDALSKSYDKLKSSMKEAMSVSLLTRDYTSSINNIKEQQKRIQEMISIENSRGAKKDDDAIKDYKDQLDELQDKLKEAKTTYLETLGAKANYSDDASSFASNWLKAFKETGDGIDSLSEDFDELFDNIIVSQLKLRVLGPYLEKWGALVEEVLNDGKVTRDEADMLRKWKDSAIYDINRELADLMDVMDYNGSGTTDMSGLQAGIQSITEQTAQALESLLNSTRQYVADTNDHMRTLLETFVSDDDRGNPILRELRSQTNILLSIDSSLSSVIKGNGATAAIKSILIG